MIEELKGLDDKFTEQLAIIFMMGSSERGRKKCETAVFRRAEGKDPPFWQSRTCQPWEGR